MASESLDGCIKLIEPQSNGNFEVTETGERLLSRQNEKCPCNMVFIFGNARSGKSFLMNRLLAQSSSALKDYNPFKVINQHLPCTKGADLACRFIAHSALTGESSELSSKDGAVSVGFVDVEGQGDAGETHDTLLALPLLLTSKIVLFNHKGAPTVSHMLERLGVLARAAQRVSRFTDEEGDGDDENEEKEEEPSFGHLHICFRDFSFTGTREEILDQIMEPENVPKVKKTLGNRGNQDVDAYDRMEAARERNKIRELLIQNFASISVWLFPQPASAELLKEHAHLPDHLIEEGFAETVRDLHTKVVTQCADTFKFNGTPLTGPSLGQVLKLICKTVNEGVEVNVPSVFLAMESQRLTASHNSVVLTLKKTCQELIETCPRSEEQLKSLLAEAQAQAKQSFETATQVVAGDATADKKILLLKDLAMIGKEQEVFVLEQNARRAWEKAKLVLKEEAAKLKADFLAWCTTKMPVEEDSMIEAKFEEMLKEQEERSRSQLKELPQILLSKEFASRQEVANEVPKSSMQIKRAENQAARLEKIKIQVEEEAKRVQAELTQRNSQLILEVKEIEEGRKRALTEVKNITAALKVEEQQKVVALEMVREKDVEIEIQRKEVADKEEEKKRLQLSLEEHAAEREQEKDKLLEDLAKIEERAKQGDEDLEQLSAEKNAKLQEMEDQRVRFERQLEEEDLQKKALVAEAQESRFKLERQVSFLTKEAGEEKERLEAKAKQLEKEREQAKEALRNFQLLQASSLELDKQKREQEQRMQKMEEDQKARQLEDAANKLTEMKVEGWLFKKGSFVKSWKRRYFLVQNGCLVYLTNAQGTEKGRLVISSDTVCHKLDKRVSGHENGFQVITDKRVLEVKCEDTGQQGAEQRDLWMQYLTLVAAGKIKS